MTFNINNIDKYYKKLYSSSNNLKIIFSYSLDNKVFHPMKNGIFKYEQGQSITIRFNVKNITSEDVIHISNLDESNISDLEIDNYEFPNPINKIFKIDYLSIPYFKIEGDKSNRYYLTNVEKLSYDSINNCLGNLTFNAYKDNIFIKPDNYSYAILIVELFNINSTLNISQLEPETNILNFEEEKKFNSFFSKYKLNYEKKEDT